jgi:hypothetical protein
MVTIIANTIGPSLHYLWAKWGLGSRGVSVDGEPIVVPLSGHVL